MDTIPHAPVPPQTPRHRRLFAAGALAVGVLAGGVGLAANNGGGEAEPAAVADGTAPHRTSPDTEAPVTATIPETTTTAVTTLPAIDRWPSTTTTTTTEAPTTTKASTTTAAPAPTTTAAPTTVAPETTTTTEVKQLFELPPFGEIPASMSETLRRDTFYFNIDGSGSSGGLLRVDEQIVGGILAAHALPSSLLEAEDQAVVEHNGALTMQQGETVGNMETVATIAGFLIPEGDEDVALAVAEGVDPQAVLDAYADQLADQRPEQGEMAYVSGFPGEQATSTDVRQEHSLIYIGSRTPGDGSSRELDVYVASTSADGTLIGPGNSGGQLRAPNGKNRGTVARGESVIRQEGIFGLAEILETNLGVDLKRPDIRTIVFVEPPSVPEVSYVAIENTNINEIYAEEIAAITTAAREQLRNPAINKPYLRGVVPIMGQQLVGEGGMVYPKLNNPVFHFDEQGNAILFGQEVGGAQLDMGTIQFFPKGTEHRLIMQAPAGLARDSLIGTTNGELTPIGTIPEFPDYSTGFRYTTPEGQEMVIGEATDVTPADWVTYEFIIADGTVTLVEQATDTPPVPTTTTTTVAPSPTTTTTTTVAPSPSPSTTTSTTAPPPPSSVPPSSAPPQA